MSSKDQGKKPGPGKQGKPNQGKSNQGQTNQGKSNQGQTNQGKSNQGKPQTATQSHPKNDKQSGSNSRPVNRVGNNFHQQKHPFQGVVPQQGIVQGIVQNVLSGILSGNQPASSGHYPNQPNPNNFHISFNLQTPNFATGVSFQRGHPAPPRAPVFNNNNRGGFRPPRPRGPRPNMDHQRNSSWGMQHAGNNDSYRSKPNTSLWEGRGNTSSRGASKPAEVRIFSGNQGTTEKKDNHKKIQMGKSFNQTQQFHSFQNSKHHAQAHPNLQHPNVERGRFPQMPPFTANYQNNSLAMNPSNTPVNPLQGTQYGINAVKSNPVYKFKKAKTVKKSYHGNTAIERAKKVNTPSANQSGQGGKRKRLRANFGKKVPVKSPETTLFSFQSSASKADDVVLPDSDEESTTLSRCTSQESVYTYISDKEEDVSSDESETFSETSATSSIKCSEASSDVIVSTPMFSSRARGMMSVFWDIENCPVPLENSAIDFVKLVRSKFLEGRTEVDFWVVCDVSNLKPFVSVELGSSDVTIVHVNGKSKNAADSKITSLLQDFRDKHKHDNVAIVLISGDSDFAPTLNNMNYKYHIHINLICKKNSRHSLIESAHKSVFYEDFIKELPNRKKEEFTEYLIFVSNFPIQSKAEAKANINNILKGVNCRSKMVNENSIEIVFPHESARSRALILLENLKIGGIHPELKCMQQENIPVIEPPSQKKKNKQVAIKSNQIESKENIPSNSLNSKGAVLCIFVCEKVADIPYWKKEFETVWNSSDFTLKWEGGLYDGYFLASFKSLKQAQKARKILEKNQINNPSAPKFLKLIKEDNILNSLEPINSGNESMEDQNKRKIDDHIHMIESKKTTSVNKHKKIIDDLKTLNNSSIPGSSESVASKRIELNEQLVTFINYTNNAIEKLKKLDLSSKLDDILIEILHDYSRECNCITNALPIYAKKNSILKKIRKHQVVVIRAETGSGKSTQLAQYIWRDQSLSEKGLVVCTQPRKIAAITLAKHVSSQLNYKLGDKVGYQVGMAVRKSENTSILYVTDFAMLKMLISNEVKKISVIIVDEAHERTLYTDLLLGMIKSLLPTQPHLKLIITSATIETSIFSKYFNLCDDAILEVSGRTFPIEDIWLNKDVSLGWDYFTESVNTVCTLIDGEIGDILVFLTTPFETEKAVKVLTEKLDKKKSAKVKILQLHGRLDVEEQQKVFDRTPSGMRKVVFATNCAETSVTVPGVKFVVDCGMVKESCYDAVRNMSVMSVNFVSQSSAEQRRGRAGRTQTGKCYRLYSKSNYNSMVKNNDPEILRVNLGQALLRLMKIGVTDPLQFDFVQSPPKESLNHAMNQLIDLNAVNLVDLSLTDLGEMMSCLPLEPRLSHLVYNGINFNVSYEAVVLAALVTVSRNIFFRTAENKSEADVKKLRFCQSESDFLTFFEVYKEWSGVPKQSKSKWCTLNCINARSLRTAHELVNELLQVLEKEANVKVLAKFSEEPVQDVLLKQIFQSFFQNLCIFSGSKKLGYKSLNVSGSLQIHPSSSLYTFGHWRPPFLIYDAILKTEQTYLINVSPVSREVIAECVENFGLQIDLQALEELQLTTYAISPIGKIIILRDLIGKKGVKRKLIEAELRKCVGTDNIIVDIEVDKGELKILGPNSKYDEISNIVCPVIQSGQEALLKEDKDVIIYPELCAIMSAGINIKDVILHGEFRDLKVILKADVEITSVVQKLETCGQVISVREFNKYFKVTFLSPMQAKQALENFKSDPSFTLNKLTKFFVDNKTNQYKILVSFSRRPCTGVAYLTVDPSDSTALVFHKLAFLSLIYKNVLLKFSISKKTGDIQVNGLPSQTDRKDFMEFINSKIIDYGKISKCVILRTKAFESPKEEINKIKENLLQMFGEFTSKELISVDMKKPTSNDVNWNAIVYFKNSHHGETALKVVREKNTPWQNFQIKATLQTFLYCKLEVFSAIKDQIQEALEYFKKSTVVGNTLDITAVPKDNGNCQIEITSNNLGDMYDARKCILTFLLGDTIECNGPMVKLFTGVGQDYIKKITENLSNCYVELNYQKKVLTIFGGDSACSIVKYKINEFFNQLEKESFDEISLMSQKGRPGILRELLKKYGHDLAEMKNMCGLTNIEINSRNHILKVMGSVSSLSKCKDIITELKVQMEGIIFSEDEETCPVCFSPISENFHRLEYCGHGYCKDCILHLLQSSENFPLTCSKEECGDLIVVADIDWAMKEMVSIEVSLFKKSLTEFVKNREDVSFCPSPDCQQIFRVTSYENTYECPSCNNSICTQCQVINHYGMSCSLYQAYKKDKDVSLKIWLQADPDNRKICPKCSSPIEKDGGCNHMTCFKCKSHICWLCLRVFPTGPEVYDHQPDCPKN